MPSCSVSPDRHFCRIAFVQSHGGCPLRRVDLLGYGSFPIPAVNELSVQRRVSVKLSPFHAIAFAESADDVLHPVCIVATAVSGDIKQDVFRFRICRDRIVNDIPIPFDGYLGKGRNNQAQRFTVFVILHGDFRILADYVALILAKACFLGRYCGWRWQIGA